MTISQDALEREFIQRIKPLFESERQQGIAFLMTKHAIGAEFVRFSVVGFTSATLARLTGKSDRYVSEALTVARKWSSEDTFRGVIIGLPEEDRHWRAVVSLARHDEYTPPASQPSTSRHYHNTGCIVVCNPALVRTVRRLETDPDFAAYVNAYSG